MSGWHLSRRPSTQLNLRELLKGTGRAASIMP
ncbi:hypothetical protein P3T23_008937 [Paraburkholderia sp. GAS448]